MQILFVTAAHAISRSTMFCRQAVDPNTPPEFQEINNCWDSGFESASIASPCLTTSGETTCRCQQSDDPQECDLFDAWESSNKKTIAYCADRIVYTPMKIDSETGLQVDDLSKQFSVCKDMVKLDKWEPYTRAASGRDGEKYKNKWRSTARFWCYVWDWDYTWKDNKCLDENRYLGEKCWHGVACKGADAAYDGYMLSCLDTPEGDICTPSILHRERPKCECGFLQPWLWFACGAANDVCNGHSCVLSTRDMNRYCDYYSYHLGSWGTLGQGR